MLRCPLPENGTLQRLLSSAERLLAHEGGNDHIEPGHRLTHRPEACQGSLDDWHLSTMAPATSDQGSDFRTVGDNLHKVLGHSDQQDASVVLEALEHFQNAARDEDSIESSHAALLSKVDALTRSLQSPSEGSSELQPDTQHIQQTSSRRTTVRSLPAVARNDRAPEPPAAKHHSVLPTEGSLLREESSGARRPSQSAENYFTGDDTDEVAIIESAHSSSSDEGRQKSARHSSTSHDLPSKKQLPEQKQGSRSSSNLAATGRSGRQNVPDSLGQDAVMWKRNMRDSSQGEACTLAPAGGPEKTEGLHMKASTQAVNRLNSLEDVSQASLDKLEALLTEQQHKVGCNYAHCAPRNPVFVAMQRLPYLTAELRCNPERSSGTLSILLYAVLLQLTCMGLLPMQATWPAGVQAGKSTCSEQVGKAGRQKPALCAMADALSEAIAPS